MKKETKPKNKKTNSEGTSLRFYFMLFSSVTLLLALGFSAGITALIQWLTQMRIPSEVWMLLLSLSIGTLLTLITAHYIIRPITRLNRAMSRVAKGDFTVHLNENVRMGEISSAYRNFNTMVRALGTIETLQKDFTSNVSHEFKTPISAIEGYATLLQDPTQPEAVRQEYIGKILFNSARLSSLVGNVLLLSRLENQGVPAEKTTYRLDEQLREAVLLLERKWSARGVEPEAELEEITYTGSEQLLMHVWVNLIDNAIKFDEPGGRLLLQLDRQEDFLRVRISDNGRGMTGEQMAHIFERFYQADGSHTAEGSGLGLALVRQIIIQEGGDIHVKSVPGEGTCFTVLLKDPSARKNGGETQN